MGSATSKEARKKSGVDKPSLNMDELRELADLIEERGFTDFEFENEKIRVRMSKKVALAPAPAPVAPAPPVQAPVVPSEPPKSPVESSASQTPSPEVEEQPTPESDDDLRKITSPIVGTFYRSPSPDKDPYVKEGDVVSEDTTVCIVEAMKLMNEIQAETSGEVVKVYVENGQPVEFGQPLFGIKQ